MLPHRLCVSIRKSRMLRIEGLYTLKETDAPASPWVCYKLRRLAPCRGKPSKLIEEGSCIC
jgi:hypothetical protein